jgi:hypothetical protein
VRRAATPYTIGLFGDMPYNAAGRAQYPNLLADINASHVAFSVFDGDLKAGGDGPCADRLYTTAIANFNTLERPLVWLPGDNDWTDCWGRYGPSTLPYSDPLERLAFERLLFTSNSLRALYSRIISTMPSDNPGTLEEKTVLDIVAYLLERTAFPAGRPRSSAPTISIRFSC